MAPNSRTNISRLRTVATTFLKYRRRAAIQTVQRVLTVFAEYLLSVDLDYGGQTQPLYPASFLIGTPCTCMEVLIARAQDVDFNEWELFLPPEYYRNELLDQRSAIWALGRLGYLLLIGEPPRQQFGDLTELLRKKQNPCHQILNYQRPDCPIHLQRAINQALRPQAKDRHATIIEFANAVDPNRQG